MRNFLSNRLSRLRHSSHDEESVMGNFCIPAHCVFQSSMESEHRTSREFPQLKFFGVKKPADNVYTVHLSCFCLFRLFVWNSMVFDGFFTLLTQRKFE